MHFRTRAVAGNVVVSADRIQPRRGHAVSAAVERNMHSRAWWKRSVTGKRRRARSLVETDASTHGTGCLHKPRTTRPAIHNAEQEKTPQEPGKRLMSLSGAVHRTTYCNYCTPKNSNRTVCTHQQMPIYRYPPKERGGGEPENHVPNGQNSEKMRKKNKKK